MLSDKDYHYRFLIYDKGMETIVGSLSITVGEGQTH